MLQQLCLLIGICFSKLQILARQQAQREEELAQSQRHIFALQVSFVHHIFYQFIYTNFNFSTPCFQEEIEELEHENRLHSQQVDLV